MSLPRMNAVTHKLKLPSTGEEVKYRPFVVKEQKILMIANESEDEAQIQQAIGDAITACTFEKVDPWVIPSFDVEYLFINMRAKSVGNTVDVVVTCPDDNETTVPVKVDLSKVNVEMHVGHTNEISLTDDIKLIMRYPNIKDVAASSKEGSDTEIMFEMIKKCIHQVIQGDEIYQDVDMASEDLDGFIESLTNDQFDKISDFFNTMPKISHAIKVKNPKTGKTGEVILEGMNSFFV